MRAQMLIVTRAAHIDAAAVSPRTVDLLTRETVHAARRYFERPGVREDFAAWLAAQQARGKYLEEGGAT